MANIRNFFAKILSNKVLICSFVIVGTIIGSGFMSGKEVVVFFSRFGYNSYFCIFLAFLLFFALFYIFLSLGSLAQKILYKNLFARILNNIICITLSCSMFAGSYSLLSPYPVVVKIFVMTAILLLCVFCVIKGASFLSKINFIFVPIMIFCMIISFFCNFSLDKPIFLPSPFSGISLFYSVLYVMLNCSTSAVVISSFGQDMSKKQKVQASFISALALFLLLFFADIVLLQNSYSHVFDMPLLQIFHGFARAIMGSIISLGCITTLLSLVHASASSFRGKLGNKYKILICVILPFALSFCGFGFIVSTFYPLLSVLGIFLLALLFFIPFFKDTHKKIHGACKNAKDNDARHNKV